jgi:hypothetical protein
MPQPVLVALLRATVGLLRRRIRQRDRRLSSGRLPAGAPVLYCIDGYHGGITFWDWLALPRGGFWYEYCWDLVGRLLIERALARPSLQTVFDVDGHTFEQMAGARPRQIARLAQAVQTGAIEVVNGTYGQPLSLTVSGEAIVRHFYYGLRAIEEATGARVESFLSQEPQFFPQMPQVLAGFGFRRAVLRTHWAPFGSDPGVDADVVRWRGPDGSEMPTVPRYAFTDYRWLRPDHRGLEKGGLTGADLVRWGRDQLDSLRRRSEMHGVGRPLLSRVADFHMVDPARPDAPLANARALAAQGLRFVTVREYFQEGGDDCPALTWGIDDMPATIPWGLGAEALQRARTEAEGDLLAAERLDAVAGALAAPGQAAKLDSAWKNLLHAQHHDLHICGPWHSRPHGKSMAGGRRPAWLAAQGARTVAPPPRRISRRGGHLFRRDNASRCWCSTRRRGRGASSSAGGTRCRTAGPRLSDGRSRRTTSRRGDSFLETRTAPSASVRGQAAGDGRSLTVWRDSSGTTRAAPSPRWRQWRTAQAPAAIWSKDASPISPSGSGPPCAPASSAWSSAWRWTLARKRTWVRSWRRLARARPITSTMPASSA